MSADSQQEWNRLAERYRSISDEELLDLSAHSSDLTEVAHQALAAEIESRGLKTETQVSANAKPAAGSSIAVPENADPNQLVPIRRFRDGSEAVLAKMALESGGIKCELSDENMVRMNWFISNAIGGVRLFVRGEDVPAAEDILNQPIPAEFDFEGDSSFEQPKCPKCGSIDVSYEALNKPVSYASAWIGVPIPFPKEAFVCHACGAQWQELHDEEQHDEKRVE